MITQFSVYGTMHLASQTIEIVLLRYSPTQEFFNIFRRNVFEIDKFMFYDKNDLWPPLPLNLFVTNSQIYYYGISTVSFYRPHLCRASLKKLQFSTKVLKFGTFFL